MALHDDIGMNGQEDMRQTPRRHFSNANSRPSLLILAAVLILSSCSKTPQQHPAPSPAKQSDPVYVNQQYGFRFDLPSDWKGYTVHSETWEGTTQTDPPRKEHGPKIILRDPRWTESAPRQDIPIMVFTLSQWNQDLVVSAAPVPPSELGRNTHYVFALPPRYNFAFPDGFQEVDTIIQGKPLHAF
jgi:hypothetical protein